MKHDAAWTHRRLLMRNGDQLNPKALARLTTVFTQDDPTHEIGAAWAVREFLRQLLAAHGPTRYSRHETAHRRTRFLDACITADMPQTTRLAGRIMKWWPEIEGFLELGVRNARTEGCNRVLTQIKRVACGFRNQDNDQGASCCTARLAGPSEPSAVQAPAQVRRALKTGRFWHGRCGRGGRGHRELCTQWLLMLFCPHG